MICEKFGWTWDYLNHGIPFNIVRKITIDGLVSESEDEGNNGYPTEIKEQSAADFAAMLNNFSYE